jgi:ribose transport system ATP-binding protein
MSETLLLEAVSVTKRFPGVLALDGVDFKVRAGAVNALVGENGAGKSTLMNILSGVYTAYEGTLHLEGKPVYFANVADAQQAGIVMIHQELNLVPHMTVAENIFLGREPLDAAGLIDYSTMKANAKLLLDRLHFDASPDCLVVDLRVGQQQIVEIAKALAKKAKVLIMDEPTSSLSEKEVCLLFKLIRSLLAEGRGIVYITHKMEELRLLADYVTVFRDGRSVYESAAGGCCLADLVKHMVGRDTKDFFVKTNHAKGAERLSVDALSLQDPLHQGRFLLQGVSLSVSSAEVLGIYGLKGAGRTELLEALFGVHGKRVSGRIHIDGQLVTINTPEEAIQHGLALIPEDRKRDGLVLGMTLEQNTSLASLWQFLTHGLVSQRKEHLEADRYREQLHIKSHSCSQEAGQLSGGNQQKVVLSKWLLTHPRILLLDEPTRGIDISAKNDIYALMDKLAGEGMAIIVVSSELQEIMAVSDRILTLCEGRLTAAFDKADFTEEAILKAALPGCDPTTAAV